MKRCKKIFFLMLICTVFLFSQKVFAATASSVADKTIHYTAKGTYYLTKYTLKTCWFIIKTTAKGAVAVTKSVYTGAGDAFAQKNTSVVPVKEVTKRQGQTYTKPSNPAVYNLPPAPEF